jgi:hypothetical protein
LILCKLHNLRDTYHIQKRIRGDSTVSDHRDREERNLPQLYGAVQSAIWLIGLALLAWTGWWFPGILVLVAISGVTQALLQRMAKKEEETTKTAESARAAAMAVPANCPTCGAAISAGTVTWTSPTTANCPYCKAAIPLATTVKS